MPVVLARVFGQTEFGTYKQVFLIYATLWAVAQVGMAECLYYFVPREPNAAGEFVGTSILSLGALGGVCLAALTLFDTQVAAWLANPGLAPHMPKLGLFVMLMLVAAVLEISMIASHRYRQAAATYLATDIGRAVLLVVPAAIWGSLGALLWGAVIFAALRVVATVAALARLFGASLRPQWQRLREQARYALPFAAAVVVQTVTMQFHKYAVSYTFGPALFAIYAVGCLQIPLVSHTASSASDVLMVRMADAYRRGEGEHALRSWHETTRKLALILCPMAAVIVAAGDDVIALLFTQKYARAAPIFKMAAGLVVLGILQTDGVLRVFAKTHFILGLNSMRLSLTAIAIWPALSVFGLVGGMLISVVAMAVGKVVAIAQIGRLMHVRLAGVLPWGQLGAMLAVAALAAGAGSLFRSHAGLPVFASLLTTTSVTLTLYLGLAVVFGLVRRAEIRAALQWLRAPAQS